MTWIMFDNIMLNPESGNNFCNFHKEIRYYNPSTSETLMESFELEDQAQQRFEELKQQLIRKPRLLINTEGTFKEILNGEEV